LPELSGRFRGAVVPALVPDTKKGNNMSQTIQSSRPGWATGWRRALLLTVGLAVVSSLGIASAQTRYKQFTQTEVNAILSQLRTEDPALYLIRLPVFRDGRIIGTRTYGTLPMREVELRADSLRIALDRNANVLGVFDPREDDDGGGGGGGGGGDDGGSDGGGGGDGGDDGGGPGSHINTQSAAWNLASRINILLEDIEVSSYQFLR
jgi:uncharacterized membrane protein YgcG